MTDLRRAHRPLLAVCATLTLLPALFVPLSLPLGWDEIVYATRFPPFARGLDVPFEAPRTRGVPALIAPVALWSDSVVLLRAWLSLVSGAALYAGFLPWLRALPDRPLVVPLAAAGYGTLWSVLFYAGSAMPNHATAMGATAAVGCFVRYGGGRSVSYGGGASGSYGGGQSGSYGGGQSGSYGGGQSGLYGGGARRGGLLCGVVLGLAVASSMRPNDAVWVAVPLLLAPLLHRPWRAWAPAVAVVAGFAAGLLPWVVESVLRYGGVAERLALATGQQGGMRPQFALPYLVTALDGPLLCRPCAGDSVALPVALWWFALPVLAGAGLWLVRREPPVLRAALLLATVVALASALTYAFLVDYTAPRFLFTTYALLMLPAAVALRALFLAAHARGRAAVAVLAVVLCAHLAVQWATLAAHSGIQAEARRDWVRIATALRAAGVGPHCVLGGNSSVVPVAYTAHCHPAAQHPERAPDALVLRRTGPPAPLRHWRVLPVSGSYNGWRIALPPATAPTGPGATP